MADRIKVAELFAEMGLDVEQFRGAVRKVRQEAQENFEATATQAFNASQRIKSALNNAFKIGGEAEVKATQAALKDLIASGAGSAKALAIVESEAGRAAIGLKNAENNSKALKKSLDDLATDRQKSVFGTDLSAMQGAASREAAAQKARLAAEQESNSRRAAAIREDLAAMKEAAATEQKIKEQLRRAEEKGRQTDLANERLMMRARAEMSAEFERRARVQANAIGHLGSQLVSTGHALNQFGNFMTYSFTLPLVGAGAAIVGATAKLETMRATLTRTTGSKDLAEGALSQLRLFVDKAPIGIDNVAKLTRRVQELRISSGSSIETVRTLGDAVFGLGGSEVDLERVVKAFGDIRASGKLAGQEVRQLINANIPAIQILSKELGKTPTEIKKLMRDGALDATTTIDALLKGLNGRFAGEMENRMNTVAGEITKLKNQLTFTLQDLGTSQLPLIKDLLGSARGFVSAIGEAGRAFASISPQFQKLILGGLGFVAAIGPISKILGGIAMGGGGALKVIQAISTGITGAGGLTAALGAVPGAAWAALALGVGAAAAYGVTKLSTLNKEMDTTFDKWQRWQKAQKEGKTQAQFQQQEMWNARDGQPWNPEWAKDVPGAGIKIKESITPDAGALEKAANKAEQARRAAFADLGIKDFRTEINEYREALIKYRKMLTDEQVAEANANFIRKVIEASEVGVVKTRELLGVMNQVGEGNFITTAMFGTDKEARTTLAALDQTVNSFDSLSETAKGAYQNFVLAGDGFKHFNIIAYEGGQALGAYSDAIERMNGTLRNFRQVPKAALGLPGEDTLRIGAATSVLGIRERGADIAAMREAAETLQRYASVDANFRSTAAKGWREYYRARLEDGGKLTRQEQEHYDQINRQLGAAKRLEGMWRGIRTQVSTIITDFSRSAIEILIPRNSERQDPFTSDVMSGFQRAYQQLSSQGYSNPKAALQSTIAAIRNATTLAEANRIAIKAFGDVGPIIAKGIREGVIAGDKLVETLDKISKNIEVANTKGSKMKQLFDEVRRSILRAFAEEVAQAVADFGAKHLKKVVDMLGDMLTKIPVIGKALEKIFGIGGKGGVLNGPQIPGLPGNGSAIPAPPITIPPFPSGGSAPRLPSGGGVGGGGTGALDSVSKITGIATGAISAATGVLSYLQGRRMEQDIGRMEVTSRQIFAELSNFRVDSWAREANLMKKLDDIWNTIMVKFDENTQATREFAGVGGTGGGNIYIYLNDSAVSGPASAVKMLTDAVTMIRRQGYTGKGSV